MMVQPYLFLCLNRLSFALYCMAVFLFTLSYSATQAKEDTVDFSREQEEEAAFENYSQIRRAVDAKAKLSDSDVDQMKNNIEADKGFLKELASDRTMVVNARRQAGAREALGKVGEGTAKMAHGMAGIACNAAGRAAGLGCVALDAYDTHNSWSEAREAIDNKDYSDAAKDTTSFVANATDFREGLIESQNLDGGLPRGLAKAAKAVNFVDNALEVGDGVMDLSETDDIMDNASRQAQGVEKLYNASIEKTKDSIANTEGIIRDYEFLDGDEDAIAILYKAKEIHENNYPGFSDDWEDEHQEEYLNDLDRAASRPNMDLSASSKSDSENGLDKTAYLDSHSDIDFGKYDQDFSYSAAVQVSNTSAPKPYREYSNGSDEFDVSDITFDDFNSEDDYGYESPDHRFDQEVAEARSSYESDYARIDQAARESIVQDSEELASSFRGMNAQTSSAFEAYGGSLGNSSNSDSVTCVKNKTNPLISELQSSGSSCQIIRSQIKAGQALISAGRVCGNQQAIREGQVIVQTSQEQAALSGC